MTAATSGAGYFFGRREFHNLFIIVAKGPDDTGVGRHIHGVDEVPVNGLARCFGDAIDGTAAQFALLNRMDAPLCPGAGLLGSKAQFDAGRKLSRWEAKWESRPVQPH